VSPEIDAETAVSPVPVTCEGVVGVVKNVAKVGSSEYLNSIKLVSLLNAFTNPFKVAVVPETSGSERLADGAGTVVKVNRSEDDEPDSLVAMSLK
jgi:hypothetical protein